MTPYKRRTLLAAALTLPAAAIPRKPAAAEEGLRSLDRLQAGEPAALPDLRFTGADGAEHGIAEYRGRGVVLNMWATWCVPCVAEMAALDNLARQAPDGIAVLALSSDRGGAPVVQRFYMERGIHTLPVLLDPRGAVARSLGARGIPTTVLIDRDGQERARVEGAADWASPDSVAAILRTMKV
jgi:thiol-disulfide isomerase/thioredoxin